MTRTLKRTAVIMASPEQVWDLVGDFHGLADWHPQVPPSTAGEDAAVRVFAIDGKVLARERLLSRDPGARSYTYTVLDPMLPVTEYVATLAVLPHDSGATEVVWSAHYRAAEETVPQVEAVFGDGTYGSGLAALQEKFAQL